MQSNILNIENWSSYKDEVGTHYTYKINNHYTYELYIGYDNIILDNDLYNLTICKIEEDDYIVNQYYIYCVTENCNIGYPIKYCPVCGAKLE